MKVTQLVLAALVAALSSLGVAAAPARDGASMAPPSATEETLAELEQAFWYCDYVGTTEGTAAAPVRACRFATERLREVKFGGDFDAMLLWWRQHKPAEHRKVERLLAVSRGEM